MILTLNITSELQKGIINFKSSSVIFPQSVSVCKVKRHFQ